MQIQAKTSQNDPQNGSSEMSLSRVKFGKVKTHCVKSDFGNSDLHCMKGKFGKIDLHCCCGIFGKGDFHCINGFDKYDKSCDKYGKIAKSECYRIVREMLPDRTIEQQTDNK